MLVVLRQVCSHAADECSLCAPHHGDNISQKAFEDTGKGTSLWTVNCAAQALVDCWLRGVQG